MRNEMYQAWPDRTLVRFKPEAVHRMLQGQLGRNRPSTVAALLKDPDAVFTALHVQDDLHDVVLEETCERWGTTYLEPVDLTAAQYWREELRPRKGSWIETYTGKKFYVLDPRPSDVDPADIAHALAMLCRYNGHVREHYSVAQHCVLVSRVVEALEPEHALWALLHDASEAYVGDMVRPLKQHVPQYIAAEEVVVGAIMRRHGLPSTMPAVVDDVDRRIVHDERAALMSRSGNDWNLPGDPIGIEVEPWHARRAEHEWLSRYHELLARSPENDSAKKGLRGTLEPVDGKLASTIVKQEIS